MKLPAITYFVSDNEYSSTSNSDDRYFNSNKYKRYAFQYKKPA